MPPSTNTVNPRSDQMVMNRGFYNAGVGVGMVPVANSTRVAGDISNNSNVSQAYANALNRSKASLNSNRPTPDDAPTTIPTKPKQQQLQQHQLLLQQQAQNSRSDAPTAGGRVPAQNRYTNAIQKTTPQYQLGIAARPPNSNYGPTVRNTYNAVTGASTGATTTRPLKAPAASPNPTVVIGVSPTTPRVSNKQSTPNTASVSSRMAAAPVTPSPTQQQQQQQEQRATPSPTPHHHHQQQQRKTTATSNAAASRATADSSPSSSTSPQSSLVCPSVGSASDATTVASSHMSHTTTASRTAPRGAANSNTASAAKAFGKTSLDALEWRKHGKQFRAHIVWEDERVGGNGFKLSNDCSIERYYKVAERVLEQFLSTSIRKHEESTEALAESYLVGNRLVKFLSIVLPTHPEYFSNAPNLQALRKRSQGQLVELLQYLEEVAIVIDELEYNRYILRDLTPEEENLVLGLTGVGRKSPNNRPRPYAHAGSSASSVSTQPTTPQAPPPHYTTREENDYDENQISPTNAGASAGASVISYASKASAVSYTSKVSTHSRASTTTSSVSRRSGGGRDTLHQKVAKVVRVTEAFSDVFESKQEEVNPSSNLFLKQTLLAAAATAGKWPTEESAPPTGMSSQQPPSLAAPPAVTRTNRPPTPGPSEDALRRNQQYHHSDPDMMDFISSSSSSGTEESNLEANSLVTASTSSWDTNPFSDVVESDQRPHSRIDLLTMDDSNHNNSAEAVPSNTNGIDVERVKAMWRSQSGAASQQSSAKPIPKLKEPPKPPPRELRAAAAARFEQYYSKRQQIEEKKSVDGVDFPSSFSDEPVLRTRIEERLERASAVQQALDSMDRSLQRWRRPERNPTNPFDVDEDTNMDDGQTDKSFGDDGQQLAMSNRTMLSHFKGCVKCLLD